MSEVTDPMSPEASPAGLTKRSGVRRVNNVPMYILGAIVIAFVVVMALVAADRAAKQGSRTKSPHETTGSTAMFAREIAGNQQEGFIEAVRPPHVPQDPISVPLDIVRPTNPDAPPRPPVPGHPGRPPVDDEAERFRMTKMQMFGEAVKAKTAVRIDAARSPASARPTAAAAPQTRDEMLNRIADVQQQISNQRGADPTAAYQARLAQIRSQAGLDGLPTAPSAVAGSASPLLPSAGTPRDAHAVFGASGKGDRWRLDAETEPPRSPYELRAGFVLPATLISGINSDLPGQIMAQVSQDVYDTATGRWKLVPQGSRLVGRYSSEVVYGQSRVLVAWQRIVFPDGKALDIGSMPGGDAAGYSGFSDGVNNHYLRIFGSALLMSAITAGVSISQDCESGNGNDSSGRCALTEALGQQLGMATAALIVKNLNIAPTLEIRPGYRFNVVVTKDMTFSKPYRSFDY